ncbi:hypothetical protein HYH03_015804 [Edaphochlamys debaryana]|uniref:FAD dependent oxidoreductase domain-containing protein n=1 Tax=Edaphochlamys debaryana TaxID=47281 RepID=A0A835XLF3_9CHLO|nr:hypothetical protein HYH03_015804 [Edaphochlamys debaryana]|eukprot:KAG2485422.1 hypothetical protein HYH03_015804 [Edaphochlamys debaryana]
MLTAPPPSPSTSSPTSSSSPAPRAPSTRPLHVVVLGGGVVGLASALRILQLNTPGQPRAVNVTVLAAEWGAATTTAGAAGLWGPYKLSETPDELVSRWSGDTYGHLLGLCHSGAAVAAGVQMCSVNSFYSEPQPLPSWGHIPTTMHVIDPRMVQAVTRTLEQPPITPPPPAPPAGPMPPGGTGGAAAAAAAAPLATGLTVAEALGAGPGADPEPLPIAWGYHWNSIICGRLRALPGRLTSLEQLGAALEDSTPAGAAALGSGSAGAAEEGTPARGVDAGADLDLDLDLVVNCVGLGARELLRDEDCYPIRGQIMRVRAPWVTQACFFDPFYIIPNRHTVVLGGTGQVGSASLEPSPSDRRAILEGCCRLLPSLRDAQILSDWVGLRPGRTRLRLELERPGARLAGTGAGTGAVVGRGAGGGGGGVGGRGEAGPGRVVRVVHNYGHGGAGLTLAWGCAGDVVELMRGEGLL